MKYRNMKQKTSQSGFSIVELLIATAVFSMVLVLVTTGILSFTRQYYKGVISSNTQSAARALMDDVTRAIEFNSGTVYPLTLSGKVRGYCIGEAKRYSFEPFSQVTDSSPNPANHQHYHGLVSDITGSCSSLTPPLSVTTLGSNLIPGQTEMLGDHMRLIQFDITQLTPSMYTITIGVAYGDDDLMCSPSVANSCNASANMPQVWQLNPVTGKPLYTDQLCKIAAGNQFCDVSTLRTTVTKRVI